MKYILMSLLFTGCVHAHVDTSKQLSECVTACGGKVHDFKSDDNTFTCDCDFK